MHKKLFGNILEKMLIVYDRNSLIQKLKIEHEERNFY